MSYFSAISGKPGAIIELARGLNKLEKDELIFMRRRRAYEMNAWKEINPMVWYFLELAQFMGFLSELLHIWSVSLVSEFNTDEVALVDFSRSMMAIVLDVRPMREPWP